MSLFKERSSSYRKIVNLENTISSLKQQILSIRGSSDLSSLKEENQSLKDLIQDLNKEITELKSASSVSELKPSESSKAPSKKRGRKKQLAPDSGE